MNTGLVDLLVIGNGALGLATAIEIKRRSPQTKVEVVGPQLRVGAATAAAGAMLGCFGEVTKYTFSSAASRARFDISRAAAARWPEWLASLECSDGSLSIRPGTTVILNARGGRLDSENFDAMRIALDECAEPYEYLDEGEIRGLDPLDDARPFAAIHLREGSVDARAVLSALEETAHRLGVIRTDQVVGEVLVSDGRATGVRFESGTTRAAGVVVVAAGAYSGKLLEAAVPDGTLMPIIAGSGVAVETRRVLGQGYEGVVRTVNRAGSCGLHLVPLEDSEYIGATNVIFGVPEDSEHLGVCHFLIQSAIDQLDRNIAFSRVVGWRIGNRPVSLDTYPVVGWSGVGGLYVLTGTFRDGFHGAPVYAAAAADEILEGRRSIDRRFVPDRRFISDLSVDQSIAEFAHQGISSWFESGVVIPRFNSARDLEPLFELKARAVYEALGTDIGLPPDLLIHLALTRKDEAADVARVRRFLDARSG